MKKLLAFTSIFLCGLPLYGQLADLVEMPDTPDMPKAEKRLQKDDLLKTWGWLLADRFNLGGFDFNEAEMESIFAGMGGYVKGEQAPAELESTMTQMQEYFADREQQVIENQLKENRAKELEFFDTLMGLPNIQMLGTGLYYQILEPGNENRAKSSDSVIVRYEGRFLDNTVFDSSEGRPPVAFKLGEVIDGWTQGLRLIGEGGKIKLYVPSKLGYGDEPRPRIPPASTLVFEISLVKIGLPDAPPDSPAPVEGLEVE